MPLRISIYSIAGQIKRFARRARALLRRNPRQMALALLVGLSLGEPLLCIVHCQVWLPFMLGQHTATAHHHHMPGMDMSNMDMSDMDMAGMIMPGMNMSPMGMPGMDAATTTTDLSTCHFRGATGSDVPFHVPPSPIHELIATFVIATVLLLVIHQLPAATAGYPPDPFVPPPFQPPRPFAIQTLTHM